MKGKESLKKQARSNDRKASKSSIENTRANGKGKEKASTPEELDDVDAEGEEDEDMPLATAVEGDDFDAAGGGNNAKKKRKLLNGLAVETGSTTTSRSGSRERDKEKKANTIPIKTIIKKVVSTTSESEGRPTSVKSLESRSREPSGKDRERDRGREKEKEREREKEKSKKRKKQETSRWYSSDSDDTASTSTKPPSRSTPTIHASSLSSSTSSIIPRSRQSAQNLPPSSAASHSTIRSRFYELYAPYAVLHSRLSSIRSALELGQSIHESSKQLRSLVEECEKRRAELESIKQSLKDGGGVGGGGYRTTT
jgi:hypothetical protein